MKLFRNWISCSNFLMMFNISGDPGDRLLVRGHRLFCVILVEDKRLDIVGYWI